MNVKTTQSKVVWQLFQVKEDSFCLDEDESDDPEVQFSYLARKKSPKKVEKVNTYKVSLIAQNLPKIVEKVNKNAKIWKKNRKSLKL